MRQNHLLCSSHLSHITLHDDSNNIDVDFDVTITTINKPTSPIFAISDFGAQKVLTTIKNPIFIISALMEDLSRRFPIKKNDNGEEISNVAVAPPPRKVSDALPLPLYLTNTFFLALFFYTVYFLLGRWREKIRNSTPLHVVDLSEICALIGLFVSCIYNVGFFGVDFIFRSSSDDDVWVNDEDLRRKIPCGQALDCEIKPNSVDHSPVSELDSVEDEEIVKSVIEGTIPSYSLETKLGDCKRAAAIRREAVQRITGKSLTGLPLEGFDYDSILGQCCEMPVGYIQIPVGIAGPLLLDGVEYSVPMATTEGCLVASTNRGCKAIHLSGGAFSVLMKDAMTRAPVVRFPSARRAALVMFYLQDPANFERLSLIFNK